MTPLVAYRSSVVTPDTAEALRNLERAGVALGGVRLKFDGVASDQATWDGVAADPGPTGQPAHLSLRPTGREVYLSLDSATITDPTQRLAALWGMAIPLGFMPWSRYPLLGAGDQVFHYRGPWATLVDFLHGEGRGEHAWPSLAAAAQSEVGRWAGPRSVEVTVQMHLHRLGINCGLVDGIVGERTLNALRSLGLGGMAFDQAATRLATFKTPAPVAKGERGSGYFSMKGAQVEAFASGGVQVTRTRAGFGVTSDGPGRLIFLFGESS